MPQLKPLKVSAALMAAMILAACGQTANGVKAPQASENRPVMTAEPG